MLNRLGLLSAVLLTVVGWAQEYRFDMGGPETPVAAGYVQVTSKDVWAAGREYGWAAAPSLVVNRNEPTNPWFAAPDSLEYRLYSDGLLSLGENTFTFRVKPGRYVVTALLGDLALGEARPGNSLWANGVLIVQDLTTNAQVKAIRFAVAAPEGLIALRFRADSDQRYATVQGVTATPLAATDTVETSTQTFPETPPTRETYRRNWEALQDQILADWAQAKRELAAEGIDVATTRKLHERLQSRPGFREYWGWSLGGGSWERLAAQTDGLDASRLLTGFKEMGIDGFQTNSAFLAAQLTRAGMQHAVSGSAERFPRADLSGITLNQIKTADGTTKTVEGVWSNMAPEVVATFQEVWRQRLTAAAPGASFFLIDEPRGMWGVGGFGDYSAPAQEAFKRWCIERGYTDLAAQAIPERGRTLNFYRFYQFRLESVALFVKAFTKDTPAAPLPIAPGNGNLGPEQMNHNCYWPPAMARHGLISTCWGYDDPASCKAYAETTALAREFGGRSMIVPPLYPEQHTFLQALPMHVACASAMTDRVSPWHFGGPLNGPDRAQWMKNVFLSARLTHGMDGLQHTPPLYVWCPESIVYNDLVEQNRAEADHWRTTWQALYDANLDYAVTNTLALPNKVVLYSCARPVLSASEFEALRKFLGAGGLLLTTFTDTPTDPDGKPLAGWAKLPTKQIVNVKPVPAALEAAVRAGRNLKLGNPAVKTFLYVRDGKRVHLLSNTSLTQAATVTLPWAATDLLAAKRLAQGATLTLPPARHALLAEN